MCFWFVDHHLCNHETRHTFLCDNTSSTNDDHIILQNRAVNSCCPDCCLESSVPRAFPNPNVRLTGDAHAEILNVFFRFDYWQNDNNIDSRHRVVRNSVEGLEVNGILKEEHRNYLRDLIEAMEAMFHEWYALDDPRPLRYQRLLYSQLVYALNRDDAREQRHTILRERAENSRETDLDWQKQIDRLLSPVSLSTIAAGDRDCHICKETFGEVTTDGDDPEFPCRISCPSGQHIFGSRCIRKWISEGKDKCPLCNFKFGLSWEYNTWVADIPLWMSVLQRQRPVRFVSNGGMIDLEALF